jgi:hypothetical protein
MRYLTAIVVILLATALTAGCCSDPQYPAPVVQPGQSVYCVPQAQVQPQLGCPPGTVPVQCQQY